MAWWQELSQDEVEDYFDDMEFFFEDMKEYGWAVLPAGSGATPYPVELVAKLAEWRWSPAYERAVPSRLWDATTPSSGLTIKAYDKRTHRKET